MKRTISKNDSINLNFVLQGYNLMAADGKKTRETVEVINEYNGETKTYEIEITFKVETK